MNSGSLIILIPSVFQFVFNNGPFLKIVRGFKTTKVKKVKKFKIWQQKY